MRNGNYKICFFYYPMVTEGNHRQRALHFSLILMQLHINHILSYLWISFSARLMQRLYFSTNKMYSLLQVTKAKVNLSTPVLSLFAGPQFSRKVILPWHSRENGMVWSFVFTNNIGMKISYLYLYLSEYPHSNWHNLYTLLTITTPTIFTIQGS